MLKVTPTKLTVKNFKCLRDVTIDLNKLNIVIGPNGSGKTSLIEALMLLKLTLRYIKGEVVNPFLEWWGYNEAVWNHNEKLNIELGIGFNTHWIPEEGLWRETYGDRGLLIEDAYYKVTLTGRGGKFQILKEELKVGSLTLMHGASPPAGPLRERPPRQLSLGLPLLYMTYDQVKINEDLYLSGEIDITINNIAMILPNMIERMTYPATKVNFDAFAVSLFSLYYLLDKAVVLRTASLGAAKEPSRPVATHTLTPDADNLPSLILTAYGGEVPEKVRSSIAYILGKEDVRIRVVPTRDGRVFLRLVEDSLELNPPSIPDGVIKLLAIEVALDQGAPLLAVDELENSLHVNAIHRLLDDARNSGSVLLATTHSPAVIDLVHPSEVVVMEKKGPEATATRIPTPQELATKLRELGLTLSEYLAYVKP